ncbi:LCP family protein [Arthrobacter sp. V4I6]|uniref:LCP family protein n=1 Tax=Arthrobacter sp. V4I6 TaxID=3042281 RepID=UPI0027D8D823|nr:LCP family protein [Arthrobacter sp. V4I6]
MAALLILAVAGAAYFLSRPRTDTSAPAETPNPAPAAAPETPPTPSATPTPEPEPPPVALNILLVGSDSRVNARAEAASGARSDQRSDVLVFIHLPADRQSVYGISIMRDLWVDIPGYGAAKINAALELGGVPLQALTVSALLGQRIDHTVMLDFEGFSALTDALGGVVVDVKLPFSSTVDTRYYFPPGANRLNGAQALSFVRERHAFVDGDYQRVRNQQTFLKAALAKLLNEGGLADRNTVRELVRTVLPHVTLDASFTLASLEHLAYSLRSTAPGRGVFFTLPTAGTGTSRDGQSIVLQDPAATAAVSAALAGQTLAEYVAANNLQNGN